MTFFANQQIKPKSMTWKGEIVSVYPLYASVIYGNSTSTVKVEKSGTPIMVTPNLDQLNEPELLRFTQKFKEFVFDLVLKESTIAGEKYSLAGIGARLKKYDHTIVSILQKLTIDQLFNPILDQTGIGIDSDDYKKDDLILLFYALMSLTENERFKKLTVYDWIFNDGKSIVSNLLKQNIQLSKTGIFLDDLKINTIIHVLNLYIP